MMDNSQYPIDRKLKLYNRLEELHLLNAGLEQVGAAAGWSERAVLDLSLACEELVVNTVNYGFPEGGEHVIEVQIQASRSGVEIVIEDRGVPFDPLRSGADPLAQLDMDLEDRPIGGLGIYFVKRLMDEIQYERIGNMNRIHMRKQLAIEEANREPGGSEE